MKNYRLIKAKQRSPEWLALRQQGITATDAAVIANLSPYKTPYALWAYKTGRAVEPPVGDAALRGTILEPAVAAWYEQTHGVKLRESHGVVVLKRSPWAMASLDRTIVGSPGIVEIKTSASPRWLMGVPDEVQAQVQWQMLITDAPWCDVVALLGGLKFEVTRVERDRKYQALLFLKCEEWRLRHIIDDVPPAVVGEDSAVYAETVPQASDEWTQADGGLERIASLYSEKVYEAKLLDTEIADLAMQIKEAIGDRQGVIGAGWSATWRQNKASRKVDWTRLAAEQGISTDTVNAYTLETPGARVFKFKQEAQGE